MRRYQLGLAAVLLCLIALAGCGGARTITRTLAVPPAAPASYSGKPCLVSDYFMQCALADQQPPPPRAKLRPGGAIVRYGVDFVHPAPSCSGLRAAGYSIGASYLSHDAGKDWQPYETAAYHRAGCATVEVFESTANRATAGRIAGIEDATYARSEAAATGNRTGTIDMAVDCDCTGSAIFYYFVGAHSVLGSRTGIYGGYYQVRAMHLGHVVGSHNWQTYAWSGGLWLPASIAPFEQWSNDHVVAGRSVDLDRAIAADFGQFPAPGPPPPPPDPYRFYVKHRYRLAHGQAASEYSTARTYRSHGCRRPERRTVCKTSAYHARLLAERDLFVATHHLVRGHWRKLSKARWSYPSKRQPLGSRYHGLSAIAERVCPTVQSCMP